MTRRQVNVSSRLVVYAAKVFEYGCRELIAAVESGGLKVSVAAVFADLPQGTANRGSLRKSPSVCRSVFETVPLTGNRAFLPAYQTIFAEIWRIRLSSVWLAYVPKSVVGLKALVAAT